MDRVPWVINMITLLWWPPAVLARLACSDDVIILTTFLSLTAPNNFSPFFYLPGTLTHWFRKISHEIWLIDFLRFHMKYVNKRITVNSLWVSDAIRLHISGSTLAQATASYQTAPSHYLNQCQLISSEILWHSAEWNFTTNAQCIYPWYVSENY